MEYILSDIEETEKQSQKDISKGDVENVIFEWRLQLHPSASYSLSYLSIVSRLFVQENDREPSIV